MFHFTVTKTRTKLVRLPSEVWVLGLCWTYCIVNLGLKLQKNWTQDLIIKQICNLIEQVMYSGAYNYVQCKYQNRIKHTIKQFQSSSSHSYHSTVQSGYQTVLFIKWYHTITFAMQINITQWIHG